MNPAYQAAVEIQTFFYERGWRFCIIGGVAVQRWGRPRLTQDVDVTLLTGFGSEEQYIREILTHFTPRISDAEAFALRTRVLLVQASNGVGIDIALGGLPFEEQAVARATLFEFAPGASLLTCSAEDFIVLKAFAAREVDWRDIKGVLYRQGTKLDWDWILGHLGFLCELKEEPEILDRLARLRREAEAD